MKILHIALSKGWHAQIANAEMIIRTQVVAMGYENSAAVIRHSPLENKLSSLPISLLPVAHYNSPNLSLLLYKHIRENNFDVIHVHGGHGQTRLALAILFSGKNASIFCSTRDNPEKYNSKFLFGRICDGFIVPNNLVKNYISKETARTKSVNIIPPTVDATVFKPFAKSSIRNNSVRIGLFARFDEVKGYDYYLEACEQLLAEKNLPPIKLIIGAPNYDSKHLEIEEMIAKHGLAEDVVVLGRVENVAEEISKLDIGVISSIGSEEVSRIALEYMACGVPVVAAAVGGIPELISDSVGFLVPPKSSRALADSLCRLVRNPDLRVEMAKNGRRLTEEKYSATIVCKRLERIFKKSMAGVKGAPE